MLIACKCLNLVASTTSTIGQQQQQQQQQEHQEHQEHHHHQDKEKSDEFSNGVAADPSQQQQQQQQQQICHGVKINELRRLQKSSRIYEECVEFFRQSTGPLKGLTENIVQTDLMYKVPIEPWILYYCINCSTITHAKQHTSNDDQIYLINSALLTNHEEINRLKANNGFSDVFGILIMDRQDLIKDMINETVIPSSKNTTATTATGNNELTAASSFNINKAKQNRFKNLTDILAKRLQKEIYETEERIRRYTEQQFALLKTFRENSEQEYQILVSIINRVPDELKIIDAIDNNLITAIQSGSSDIENGDNGISTEGIPIAAEAAAAAAATVVAASAKKSNDNNSSNLFIMKQQQILNLDTPPATPDSTPMSVGNSPTFRQQTSTATNIFDGLSGRVVNNSETNDLMGACGGSDPNIVTITPFINTYDSDCLFELEGMEMTSDPTEMNNSMSDIEETEDAEDALGELDSAVQIPRSNTTKSSLNIAKSLPISISSVPDGRFYVNELDNAIREDSNIDIAASIKALARSVHGDTIFGDLPRPRFSTQI